MGISHDSEAKAESVILLVENYFMTNPPGCFGGRVVIFGT